MSVYIHFSVCLVYIQSSYGLANILFELSFVAGVIAMSVYIYFSACLVYIQSSYGLS